MSDPDMGYWTYAYDLNGNLASQTDARGTTITFEYDALNRLTRKGYPDQSFAQYEYDGAENGIGFLYMKYNASAFTRYHSYDARGRLSSEIRMIGTTMIKFDYTYDFAGRQSSKSIYRNWTLFKTLRFEFYPESSLLKAVLNENSQPYTTVTQYSPQGKIEFMNHYNNTVTNYIYDYETGRISVIHSYNMSQDIIDKNYAYSQAGDVTQISNNRTGITYTYDYDHLHRLVSEQSSGDNAVAGTQVDIIEFTYAQQPGTPVHAPTQTRLNGALTEYNYTSTGNRLNRNSGIENTIYESNPDNLISKIIQGGVETTFYYDADTKRIKKTQGLSSTLYFGEDFEIINNTSTLYIFAGNLRVAKATDTTLDYYHKDHLGSTNAISRQDGTIIDSGEYLPYGLDRSANALLQSSAYKFTDQEQDDGTGLYNYDARLYDPVIGQFIMADTLVPDQFNPQSLNRYAYCLDNPLIYADPTGHNASANTALSNFATLQACPLDIFSPYADHKTSFEGSKALIDKENQLAESIQWGETKDCTICIDTKSGFPDPSTIIGFISDGAILDPDSKVVCYTKTIEGKKNAPYFDPKTMQFQNLKTDNILDGTNTGPTPSSLREALNNISETESQNKGNTGSGGGFTIICSELYRQGLMSTDIYRADSIFGMDVREHNPNVMIGYHLLCRPIVQLMKKSKIITNIVNIFAKPWSYEMAFQMGVKKEGYIMGKVIMSVGIPICATVGKIVSNDSQIFDTMMAVLFFAFLVLVFNVIMKRWKSGSDTI